MKLRTGEKILIIILVTSLTVAAAFYSKLPDQMATGFAGKNWSIHIGWSFSDWGTFGVGEDEWMVVYGSKFAGTFLSGLVMSALLLVYFVFPRLRKRAHDLQYAYYDRLFILFFGLLLLFQLFVTFWNLGFKWQPNLGLCLILFSSLSLFLIGDVITHARPGWLFSRKSGYIVKNEDIWNRTHKITGRWVKISAVVWIPGVLLPGAYGSLLVGPPFCYALLYMSVYPMIARSKLKRATKEPQD